MAPGVYVSTAKVLLTPQSSVKDGETSSSGNWLSNQQTLQELVGSERLLVRVANTLNLKGSWQALRDQVTLQTFAGTGRSEVNLFSITVKDASPQQAQKLAQAVVDEFISYVEELSAREFANTRKFLEELVAEAKDKVDATEERLLQITSARAEASQSELTVQTLNELDSDRRKAKSEVADLEAELSSLQDYLSGTTTALPGLLHDTSGEGLQEMDRSISTSRLKLLELEQLYTDNNVLVRQQRARLAKLQDSYSAQASLTVEAAAKERTKRLNERREALKSLSARILDIQNRQLTPTEKRQVAKLERELQLWEENHLNLVKQLYQARVVEQSSRRQGALTILESPALGELSREKKSRSLGAQLALALPFSIGFGVFFVLAIDLLSTSLRLVPKIEASLGIPVLTVIPAVDEEVQELWESFKREATVPLIYESLLLDDK